MKSAAERMSGPAKSWPRRARHSAYPVRESSEDLPLFIRYVRAEALRLARAGVRLPSSGRVARRHWLIDEAMNRIHYSDNPDPVLHSWNDPPDGEYPCGLCLAIAEAKGWR